MWTSLFLTEVMRDDEDTLSVFMGYASLIPFLIIIGAWAVSFADAVRRGGAPISPTAKGGAVAPAATSMLLGSFIVSEVINQAIKRTWRQPRPDGPWAAGLATSVRGSHGFGMPSAHTQTMACAAGWWAAAAVLLRGDLVRGRSARRIASLLLCLTVLVAYSRVYNWYHTVEQVCLGGALGLSLGALFRFTSPRVVTVIARGIDGACGLMA